MSEWITDRLPTKDDCNDSGWVMIPCAIDSDGWEFESYEDLQLGDAWAPSPKMPPFEPEPEYWSKPSDFPPVCWIWRPHWESCAFVTRFYQKDERVWCEGMHPFNFSDLKNARWSDRPFDRFEDGKPCTKGGQR